ncbi:MAG: hypothetical protein WD470_01775 [Rhodospirillaceae bacterium]
MTGAPKERNTERNAGRVLVLNCLPKGGQTRLDGAGTLQLALLGAAAQRTVTLDRLVDVVWCLAGGTWSPSGEIVHDALQRATRAGLVAARESWVKSVLFLYVLTPSGAQRFAELMRLPLPDHDDPAACAAASVKYGLLDLVEPADALAVTSDLRRFYLACRASLEERRTSLPPHRRFLDRCASERQAWIDFRIDALDEFNTEVSRRALPQAASSAS